jgi:hypothetical protein
MFPTEHYSRNPQYPINLISFIVSPASDWRRSFHIIYRFTSVRLATIVSYHLSFHQRQTGDNHFIIYRFTSVRLAMIISYRLSFHQHQTGDDHNTLPSESTFSTGD